MRSAIQRRRHNLYDTNQAECSVSKVETKRGLKCTKERENRETYSENKQQRNRKSEGGRMWKRIDQHGFENKPGFLAQCDVGLGPNQSDNTFEILNSFLVNQPSPFHGCLEKITGSTLLTISPNRLLPCQSNFKIPIQARSSHVHSFIQTRSSIQHIQYWTSLPAHAHILSFIFTVFIWLTWLQVIALVNITSVVKLLLLILHGTF